MNNLLEKAIITATNAHSGQIDKAGATYIMHPLRVACQLKDTKLQIVAVLHDVVEDTEITLDDIRKEFGEEIAAGVYGMTKREGETYEDFIDRCAKNPLSREVKMADLRDNMDLTRLKEVTQKDLERVEKYKRAMQYLMENQ